MAGTKYARIDAATSMTSATMAIRLSKKSNIIIFIIGRLRYRYVRFYLIWKIFDLNDAWLDVSCAWLIPH
jgi:hypothetical protein